LMPYCRKKTNKIIEGSEIEMPATGVDEIHETEPQEATGNSNIDALLTDKKWASDEGTYTTTVSFSFGSADSVYVFDANLGYDREGDDFTEPTFGMSALSDNAKDLFYGAVENIESFTNLDLQEVQETETDAGTVRIVWSDLADDDAVGWAYYPGEWYGAGDIWLISENHEETDVDFLHTMLHELGHALGLKHSFEVDGDLPAINSKFEGVDYTVMSYDVSARYPDATWSDLWPQSYMYWDILALQELYGVDMVTTGGADTYTFDLAERYHMTIWDYGGTDTISVTNGSTDVHIDLTPGSWSNVGTTIEYRGGGATTHENYSVYIADDTVIEKALGSDGDDTLRGNSVGNVLQGNDGDDVLLGHGGADVLSAGHGNDAVQGGSGDDQVWAGSGDVGADTLAGGSGNDVIAGGGGSDLLIGGGADDGVIKHSFIANGNWSSDGSDTLYGGDGNDTLLGGGWDDGAVTDNGLYDAGEANTSGLSSDVIYAGQGDDLVVATSGADTLGGGIGDDTLIGGGGDDVFYGGRNDGDSRGVNDVIDAGDGDDQVFSGAGDDSISGGDGDDDVFNGGGDDTVDAGAGDDTLWGGGGDDTFTGGNGADTFIFQSGHGDDTVTDFDVDDDILQLDQTVTDFTSTADVEAASTAQDGGVMIDLGGGNSVFLDGLALDDVSEIEFVL
jgi:serralysin